MEEYGYHAIGSMLIGLGEQLKDPNSTTRQQFHLSREQFATLIGMIKLATCPQGQMLTINGLARRWGKSPKTIHNWIDMGLVREGYKRKGDTQLYWSTSEIDEDERKLFKLGYIKKSPNHRLRYFRDMLNGFLQDGNYQD